MAWPKGRSRRQFNKAKESEVTSDNEQPEPQSEVQAKPAGKQTWAMKAGNNWDNAAPIEDEVNRLHIAEELIPEGMVLQWETRSVFGQEQKQSLNKAFRAGWTPVHAEDFGGRFADMWGQDDSGYVVHEACILCARPIELHIKAKKRDEAKAKAELALKAQAFAGGDMRATGADHPSALASNRINRTVERIDIPRD